MPTCSGALAQHGAAFGYLLGAADLAVHGATEVAIVGEPQSPDFAALTAAVARQYLPALVLAGGQPGVSVYFVRGEQLAPVTRPGTTALDAVRQLIAGPTRAERDSGA